MEQASVRPFELGEAQARARRRRRHRRWRGTLAVAVVVVAGWGVARVVRGPEVPVVAVARAELAQQVAASGRVLPPARIAIGSVTTGRVTAVNVDEGAHVEAGAPLLALDDAQARAELDRAAAAVAQATARLDRVQGVSAKVAGGEERRARARLRLAKLELTRVETLVRDGALPAEQLEQARAAAEVARGEAQTAAAQSTSATPRGAEARDAQAALAQARAAEARARAELVDRRVLAPAAGTILERDVEPGDVVQPGRTLLVLARDGETQLEAELEERNLAWLRVGQQARASADALPAAVFDATVSFIAPAVDPLRGTIVVRLRVPAPPPHLLPDMTISINVEVARAQRALVLPADAVREADGAPWVLVVRDGRARRQPVTLGLSGGDVVEVREGLAEGEVVIPVGAAGRDGQRVRARAAGS